MNKPTPLFVLAITTILATTFSVWVIATLHQAAIDRDTARLLETKQPWAPPKITCKRPEQELWDCIRHVD